MDLQLRQGRNCYGIEPGVRVGQREGARGRRMPRVHVCERRRGARSARSCDCTGSDPRTGTGVRLHQPSPPTCRRPTAPSKVVSAALDAFGGIDILVNNVATAKGTDIVNTADGEWQDAFDQTLYPAIRMSRLVVPHMRQRGGGSIIMIASIWGRESGGRMVYNAVKAAEISLAKAMAQQLAKDNIRVNSVAPGSILFPGGSWDKRQQGRSGRHGRVHQDRAAVRPLRPC